MTQKTIAIRRLKFDSYLKLTFLTGIGVGMVIGSTLFIMGLLGLPVHANIGPIRFTGQTAGFVSLVMSPLLTSFMVVWFGLIAYLPLKLILKVFKNIRFTALIDVPEDAEGMRQKSETETNENIELQTQLPSIETNLGNSNDRINESI